MSKPKRIQRSRAKGWKMPANAIYVGRPTVWGNPYVVGSELMNGEPRVLANPTFCRRSRRRTASDA